MKAVIVLLALIAFCAGQQVRFLHAAVRTTGAVDLALNGNVVVSNVAYGTISPYVTATAGLVTASIRATGTSTDVLTLPGVLLAAGNKYTISAYGNQNPLLNVLIDTILADPTAPLLRVVHYAQGINPTTLLLGTFPLATVPNPVGYTQATGYTRIFNTPSQVLAFRDITTLTNVATATVNAQNGQAFTAFLIGSPSNGAGQAVTVLLVTDSPNTLPTPPSFSLPSVSSVSFSLPSFSLPSFSLPNSVAPSIPRLFRKK
jgi:hypothetical protein